MQEKNGRAEELETAKERMAILFEQMQNKGVRFYVDDRAALPVEAVEKAVCENSPYMADYVFGNAGEIEQVRFDRITEQ